MKKTLSIFTILFVSIILTACNKNRLDVEYTCSQDYKGAALNFLNWGEYIEPKLIAEFEKSCNVKIIENVVLSNEDFKREIENGINHGSLTQYDLAVPSDYMVEYFVESKQLLAIDYSNIPNIINIDDSFKNKSYDPNNIYSVPYFWGTLGIMYNKTKLAELGYNEADLTGWSDIFNLTPSDKLFKQVYMYDTLRDLYMPALFAQGKDLNTTNPQDIIDATALLKKQYSTVAGYGTDDIKTLVTQGAIAAGVVMNGDYLSIMFNEDVNIGYVVPEEGTNLWFDNFIIPKSSKNKKLAEEFINFLLDAKVSYYNAKYVGYSTPNKAALELLKADEDISDLINTPAYSPDASIINKSQVYEDLSGIKITHNGNEINFYQFLQNQYYTIKE